MRLVYASFLGTPVSSIAYPPVSTSPESEPVFASAVANLLLTQRASSCDRSQDVHLSNHGCDNAGHDVHVVEADFLLSLIFLLLLLLFLLYTCSCLCPFFSFLPEMLPLLADLDLQPGILPMPGNTLGPPTSNRSQSCSLDFRKVITSSAC